MKKFKNIEITKEKHTHTHTRTHTIPIHDAYISSYLLPTKSGLKEEKQKQKGNKKVEHIYL